MTCGGATRPPTIRRRATGWWWPIRRWSNTSPAGWAPGLPAHVDEADLISYGLGGLIAAIERFDLSREIRFETYAITRIKGAILDELRALDWVPRSVRARARQIERANVKLEAKLQRVPTEEELADELEMSVEEFRAALMQIANSSIRALDELWSPSESGGDSMSLLDTLSDCQRSEPRADRRAERAARPHRRGARTTSPSARSW